MKKTLLTLAVTLLVSTGSLAAESRQHYVVLQRDRTPAFQVTRIHDERNNVVTQTLLIADEKGPLLRVDAINDYPNQKTIYSYSLLRDSNAAGTITLNLPVTSRTLEARREELRQHPELQNSDVPVTLSTPSGKSLHGFDREWRESATAADHRRAGRDLLGGQLVSVLSRVRELGGLPMFADLNPALGYIFDDSQIVWKSKTLMVAAVRSDCNFDARLGMPCRP